MKKYVPQQNLDAAAAAWSAVELSRHSQRPYTLDYLEKLFDSWTEIRGDRLYRDDKSLVAAFAHLSESKDLPKGQSFVVVGHQKGRKTKEKIERNFGMPHPEGYRKAQRAFLLAERFDLPLLALIDTPGAYPGIDAEERGQSEAIASSIQRLLSITVPTIAVVIGEGGSGGALALACTDIVIMFQNSTYSVISPESCAAILWSDASKARNAATALKSAAKNLKELGLCDTLLDEAQLDSENATNEMCETLHKALSYAVKMLKKMPQAIRLKKRFERYRHFDKSFMKGL